jgi:hypothetical protein
MAIVHKDVVGKVITVGDFVVNGNGCSDSLSVCLIAKLNPLTVTLHGGSWVYPKSCLVISDLKVDQGTEECMDKLTKVWGKSLDKTPPKLAKPKVHFTVVSECTLDDLVVAVNKRINEGWGLRGDILVSGLRHYILYSQAMTREY